MARIILPTRNRPTSLGGVLNFLKTFYPKAELIVADGSEDAYKDANRAVVASMGGTPAIDYRPYPYELPFFDRLLDVLRSESDPFFIMGSDDDYPLLDAFDRGEKFLRNNPDFCSALGATIHVWLRPQGMNARLDVARPVALAEPHHRALNYSTWMYSTTYAVTRRELLLERYERARHSFLSGFYDYVTGVHDCLFGKMKALPELSFIHTRNHKHSYLRPEAGLVFLRRAGEVLQTVDQFAADLRLYAKLDDDRAMTLAETLIKRRIASLCGHQPWHKEGFEASREFTNPVVQSHFSLFREIFQPDNPVRAQYESRLMYICNALRSAASSQDNAGEKHHYETLDGQMTKAPDLPEEEEEEGDDLAPRRGRRSLILVHLDPETMLELPDSDHQGGAMHILVLGQSNVANHGLPPSSSGFGSAQHRGAMHPLVDPLPGGSGKHGSVWTRFAARAQQTLGLRELVVTVLAQGSTEIADWEPGGKCFARYEQERESLLKCPHPVSHVVFHQGEKDTLLETDAKTYLARFRRLHAAVSADFPKVPWLVCTASYRRGVTSDAVRAAQETITRTIDGCHPGPDTDRFGADLRHDDTHFNEAGLAAFAEALMQSFATLGVGAARASAVPR